MDTLSVPIRSRSTQHVWKRLKFGVWSLTTEGVPLSVGVHCMVCLCVHLSPYEYGTLSVPIRSRSSPHIFSPWALFASILYDNNIFISIFTSLHSSVTKNQKHNNKYFVALLLVLSFLSCLSSNQTIVLSIMLSLIHI